MQTVEELISVVESVKRFWEKKKNVGYQQSVTTIVSKAFFLLTHSHTMTPFDAPGKQAFENTVGKGEIARYKQFLFFSTVFSICLDNFLSFLSNLKLSSANSFSLEV